MFLTIAFGLIFGFICMIIGFYGGYMVTEIKHLKSILDQYELEDARYNLERSFEDPD